MIPYKQHIAGMNRLYQTLTEQNKRLSIPDGPPIYVLPPTSIQELNVDDNAESGSLSSKESVEVITGQLVDIETTPHVERMPTPILIRPGSAEEGETDSDSIISSNSNSSGSLAGLQMEVVKNENADVPVAPPRRKRQQQGRQLNSATSTNNKDSALQIEMFELERRASPISDFSLSIADTLLDHSRRCSSQLTADIMSSTGEELHKSLRESSFNHSASTPVMTTANIASSDLLTGSSTSCLDSPRHMEVIKEHTDSITNDPWKPIDTSSTNTDAFQPGGAQIGNAPPTRAPPLKPQPYSGSGFKYFENTILTPVKVNVLKEEKSPDPLSDLFGEDGLHGYLKSNSKTS